MKHSEDNGQPRRRFAMRFGDLPIRSKLLLPMVGALAIVMVSLSLYYPRQHEAILLEAYKREADATSELFSAAVAFAIAEHSFDLVQQTVKRAKLNDKIRHISVLDEQGEPIASYGKAIRLPESLSDAVSIVADAEVITVVRPVVADSRKLGYLVLAFSLRTLKRQAREVRMITMLISICAFLVGVLIMNKISGRITSSLRQLYDQMVEVISAGCHSAHVTINHKDEVGQLGTIFNTMITELMLRQQRLVESKQRYQELFTQVQKLNQLKTIFVADASHHLRTPLTIMRGELEVALQKPRSGKEYRETLQIVADEVNSLGKIVDNLLTLARADSGNLVVIQTDVDLSEICAQQIRHLKSIAKQRKIRLESSIQPSCILSGDPGRLSEVVFNLVENALKYSPEGSVVTLRLKQDNQHTLLTVTDHGPGLPIDELDHIFERFYRGRHSGKSSKGLGLGLAICKSIVDGHGGRIEVSSAPGEGTTFQVILLNRAAPAPIVPSRG